ncbi:uncharacterized mitochondrial protein AtMg00810-like [Nicotiana tomentosiformis]|uniref:uncharacterized mitochondrial protein AtMg00810-like n=1 Tax=Nicotiana tomentosiformis TaxID=4098 RepID=UPI000877F39F|nr:uncharacterized mitochondrial protein AtMg00810-like [Nicotiana tomentosiformis]
MVIILIYVDDLLITGSNSSLVQDAKMTLHSQFKVKDLGELRYFLGIERLTIVDYDSYMGKSGDLELTDITTNQQLIGKLLYLNITRSDISVVTVQSLSQFMKRPKQSHMEADLRVVRYIKGSPGLGVLLQASPIESLIAYCDSDWAACPNTRRSVTGYVIKLATH